MRTRKLAIGKVSALLAVAASMSLLTATGCSPNNDQAPTNTANSTYMGGGNTAADKIGAERKKAHEKNMGG